MNSKNPYKINIVLWSIVLLYGLIMCIFSIYTHTHFAIVINLLLSVFDSFCLGWTICKYIEHNKFVSGIKSFENIIFEILQDLENKEKEPFKEFKNENTDK